MTSRRLLAAQIATLLALTGLTVAALVWSSELVLNLVGIALVALQIAAAFIAVNPQARGRLFCGVFLVVSFGHTYLAADPYCAKYVQTQNVWHETWATINPGRGIDYWCYLFERVGVLLTSFWLGFAVGLAAHFAQRRFTRGGERSAPRPLHSIFQLSLRTLLCCMLLCCLAIGWAARERQHAALVQHNLVQLQESCDFDGSTLYLFPWLNSLVWLETPVRLRNVTVKRACDFPAGLPLMTGITLGEDSLTTVTYQSLERLPGLERLQINGPIPEADLAHFIDLKELRTLRFSPMCDVALTDVGLAHLAAMKQLAEIEHEGSLRVTNRGAALLARLPPQLDTRQVEATLDDAGLRALALFDPRSLTLRDCRFGEEGIHSLSTMGNLHRLDIADSDLGGKSLRPLSKLAGLIDLVLARCHINDNALHDLAALPELDYLIIEEPSLTDQALDALPRFPKLRNVAFAATAISPKAVERFNASHPRGPYVRLAKPGESDPFDALESK